MHVKHLNLLQSSSILAHSNMSHVHCYFIGFVHCGDLRFTISVFQYSINVCIHNEVYYKKMLLVPGCYHQAAELLLTVVMNELFSSLVSKYSTNSLVCKTS